MKISWKIAGILGVTTLITLGITYGTLAALAAEDYRALEDEVVRRDLALVEDAIQDDLRALEASAGQTIAISNALFIGGPQDENTSFDIGLSLFSVHELDLMMFSSTNESGSFSMGFTLDAESRSFNAFDEAFGEEMQAWLALAQNDPLRPMSAVVQDNGTWYMVAVQAWAMPSQNTSISLGVGRIISEAYALELGAQTGLDISFRVHEGGAWVTASEAPVKRSASTVQIDSRLAVSAGDALIVQVARDRDIYQNSMQGLQSVGVGAMVASIGVVMVAIWLVHRFVTGRVLRLGRAVAAGDVAHLDRDAKGHDEVGELVRRFRAAEADLRRSNDSLEAFAGIVSHDLRSPLSTVSLNAKMLAHHDAPKAARIQRAVHTMDARIGALLRYARSGGVAHMREMDPAETIAGCLADMEEEIQQRNAVVLTRPMPWVHADDDLLADAVQNLLQNAMKYAGQAPKVRIYARQHRGRIGVAVQDNGPGFRTADVERMLKPLHRLDNARGVEGAGLGLATVERLVQAMQGKLQVEGCPGKGARFTIWLEPGSEVSRRLQ